METLSRRKFTLPRLSNLEDGSVAFDWDVIFNRHNTPTGCSNDALDGFCEKLKLPFRCLKNKSTACNNRRFRRFIQSCLPLRIAMVEGNHRMSAACRKFYGMDLESPYSPTDCDGIMPPETGTLSFPTTLSIVQLPGVNRLSNETLASLRNESYIFQDATQVYIASSWKNAVRSLLPNLPRQSCAGTLALFQPPNTTTVDKAIQANIPAL